MIQWLWKQRAEFEPALKRVGDFANSVVADPYKVVRRVGNTIVFGQEDGGAKVIGFIEQTAPKIDQIEQMVTEVQAGQQTMLSSLESLQVGQQALSSSVTSLQSLSMVSLGFTAILPLVLHVQFSALTKRLNGMFKIVRGLDKKFDAKRFADLKTGLDMLELGVNSQERNKKEERRSAAAVQHRPQGMH